MANRDARFWHANAYAAIQHFLNILDSQSSGYEHDMAIDGLRLVEKGKAVRVLDRDEVELFPGDPHRSERRIIAA